MWTSLPGGWYSEPGFGFVCRRVGPNAITLSAPVTFLTRSSISEM